MDVLPVQVPARQSHVNSPVSGVRTENSQSTKLLVSLKLKSLVLRNPSPTLPPRPTFLPALSFFFLAVRTLLNRSSILEGNCRAGRWKDRASCFNKRVLYYKSCM